MARSLKLVLAALGCSLGSSQSISSCGAPGDHLSNVQITLSPDPIVKGKPFTLTVTGDMDEDHVGGIADVSLDIKALGIVDKSVKTVSTYSLTPGFVKGPQKIVIGPVSMPTDLPGSVEVTGQIKVQDPSAKPIACINLKLNVPAAEASEVAATEPKMAASDPDDCRKPTDHLKDIQQTTQGQTTTTTATLDEDIAAATAVIDISIQALFVKIPVKLSIPISFSSASQPGFRKGDWKIVSTATPSSLSTDRLGSAVKGELVLNDAANSQITCKLVDNKFAEDAALVV